MGRILAILFSVVLALTVSTSAGPKHEVGSAHTHRPGESQSRGPSTPLAKQHQGGPEAAHEHTQQSRQDRDLIAQESMARAADTQAAWTKLSVVFSVLAVAVAGGVLWVTMRNGRRQLRAYLHIERVYVDWERADKDGACRLTIEVHNTGETPALRFSIGYSALLLVDVGDVMRCGIPPDNELTWDHWSSLGGDSTRGNAAYPYNQMGVHLSELHDQPTDKRMLFTGRVYYTDVYGKLWFSEFAAQYDPKWPVDRPEMAFVTANIRAYEPGRGGYPK